MRVPLAESFRGLLRQLRITRGGAVGATEIGTIDDGIQPVALVHTHYQRFDLDIWGAFGQVIVDAIAPSRFPAIGLVGQLGPTQDRLRDVWIRRIEFVQFHEPSGLSEAPGGTTPAAEVHLANFDLDTYDPFAIDPVRFPEFFATRGAFTFSRGAVMFGGTQTALDTVLLNGAPVTVVGPLYWNEMMFAGAGNTASGIILQVRPAGLRVIHDWSDPPLVLRAGDVIAVQSVAPSAPLAFGVTLQVNMYWSERLPQGRT
ncbi:MAG: hypothetical protein V3T07_09770 [Myxococcota bacterium]